MCLTPGFQIGPDCFCFTSEIWQMQVMHSTNVHLDEGVQPFKLKDIVQIYFGLYSEVPGGISISCQWISIAVPRQILLLGWLEGSLYLVNCLMVFSCHRFDLDLAWSQLMPRSQIPVPVLTAFPISTHKHGWYREHHLEWIMHQSSKCES